MNHNKKYYHRYNIYCDESRVENKDSRNMIIGALIVPRDRRKSITREVKILKNKYSFFQELKWNKAGKKYDTFYKNVITYFKANKFISFRCIVVNKSKIKYEAYHDNDRELAFFKFYYLMLRAKLADNNQYYIFLDRKPTRDKNRARSLKAYLSSYVLLHRKECNIKHLQSYSSAENVLIQLSDFFTGLMGYACNESKKSYKQSLVKYLRSLVGKKNLFVSTTLRESKFNVFVWKSNEKSKN